MALKPITDYDKIVEECKQQQLKKKVYWANLTVKQLQLELHELLMKDDDLMDQDTLFDVQQVSVILLIKSKVIKPDGTILIPKAKGNKPY